MSDKQVEFFLFGFREEPVLRINPTDVAKFIMGGEVEMSDALAAALRLEFNAQERYRRIVNEQVQKTCGELLREACATVSEIEHPITSTDEAFWRGYAVGRYQALALAASALSEITIVAALAMETPKTETSDGGRGPEQAALGEPG